MCACPEDLGFDSMSECSTALGYIDNAERDCFEDAFDGHHGDALDYLECANAALRAYEQCLANNVDCDPGAHNSCTTVYVVAESGCTQLPPKVDAEFLACSN